MLHTRNGLGVSAFMLLVLLLSGCGSSSSDGGQAPGQDPFILGQSVLGGSDRLGLQPQNVDVDGGDEAGEESPELNRSNHDSR